MHPRECRGGLRGLDRPDDVDRLCVVGHLHEVTLPVVFVQAGGNPEGLRCNSDTAPRKGFHGEFEAEAVFANPRHPYTKLLADSAPVVGRPLTAPEAKGTELPNPLDPPPGCAFAGRCPLATERCRTAEPKLRPLGEDQLAACHHPLES